MKKKISLLVTLFFTAMLLNNYSVLAGMYVFGQPVYAEDGDYERADGNEDESSDLQKEDDKKYEDIKKHIEEQQESAPDSLLKDIHFGGDILIDFHPEIYKYVFDVPESDKDILIKAQPKYKTDKVFINGIQVGKEDTYRTFVNLDYGKNVIIIEVHDSYSSEITYYYLYAYRGGEKCLFFDDIKMDGKDIGFRPENKISNIELDEDDEYVRLQFEPKDESYSIKVNDTVIGKQNTIKLKFSGVNKYTVNVELIDNDSGKKNKYVICFYVGIPVTPDVNQAINHVLKVNQWVMENGRWRYNDSFGKYISSAWFYDERYRKYFYFNKRGYMVTGWLQGKDGNSYYLNEHGAMETGWIRYNEKWYYLNDNGAMQSGWIKDKNKWYYLDDSGIMQNGWIRDKGKWYYLNKDGSMRTGWIIYKKEYYYLGSDGSAKTGWTKYNNNWYYMDRDSAKMISGRWMYDSGNWYYINGDGTMRTGWLYKGGKIYYLNSNGSMNTANKVIKGYEFKFDKDGSVDLKY